ncbi:hypothetical protein LIER_24236 [Lithospermum erythrorhizon]|uniref:Uncharacterized protein n=1 Tax=Lithospermum erythrorhizon TaxID=34254 RepID=A0AAV3R4M3_LITER
MDALVPRAWVPLARADRPKSPPTEETFAALEKLKRIFRQKMHWMIFYKEEVLVGADQVHDREFDLSRNPIPWSEILLAAKETAHPNTVPLESMRGKKPIAFKKVKVVKKAASSPRPSVTADLPLRQDPSANLTPHSSPAVVEPSPSSFSPPDMDLPHDPPSTSLVGKRPSDEAIFQGKEKRARAPSELSDPPKGSRGQQICEGIPFKSNLQYFHAVRPFLLEGLCQGYSNDPHPLEVYGDMCRHLIQVANVGFELARRADNLGEENKDLKAQAPFEKVASLEEELAKLSGYRDAAVAKASRPIQEVQWLECEVKRLQDAASQHPKKLWAAVENYKQSFEIKAALAAAVESFKKSPEFVDALGANAAYGAYSFTSDAPSEDEEDEETAPLSSDAAPKA